MEHVRVILIGLEKQNQLHLFDSVNQRSEHAGAGFCDISLASSARQSCQTAGISIQFYYWKKIFVCIWINWLSCHWCLCCCCIYWLDWIYLGDMKQAVEFASHAGRTGGAQHSETWVAVGLIGGKMRNLAGNFIDLCLLDDCRYEPGWGEERARGEEDDALPQTQFQTHSRRTQSQKGSFFDSIRSHMDVVMFCDQSASRSSILESWQNWNSTCCCGCWRSTFLWN